MAADPEDGRVLRAKYLDWCSARIAERFLQLTPEQIYELAERATADVESGRGPGAEAAAGGEPSYQSVVERVTEVLHDRMHLPTFAEWAEAYSESPEEFEDELLGFWREPH